MASYTDEKNVQLILTVLKYHGIRHAVISPGTTNMALVVSMQSDPFFEVYSCVDERSAAYMACGMSAELQMPVVLSCTGATASRNYGPGLTEAFYRKLPILAVTSTQQIARVGQHVAQVIDRSSLANDVAKLSVHIPVIKDEETLWECEIKLNNAVLELKRDGGGPVHINLTTAYSTLFNVVTLPPYRMIDRITADDQFPPLSGKIAVFIGARATWSDAETEALDRFCAAHNAVAFCDHTSGYYGKYRVQFAVAAGQENFDQTGIHPDILVHVGEISGDYDSLKIRAKQVWRVNPDGEIRDTFRKLRYVFQMSEFVFFQRYAAGYEGASTSYRDMCLSRIRSVRNSLPELSFSNIWIASQIAHKIPENSTIHFGILNSLRAWNYFELPRSVRSSSNVGGFGIDGCMSSFIGASLADKNRLYFLVIGDLAFFYDMNVLGNRHVGANIRILLVNNGKGIEFTQYGHNGHLLGSKADSLVAASGHFGRQSRNLVGNYAKDLGFRYISASSKAEFEAAHTTFLSASREESPLLFEVFTNGDEESDALFAIRNTIKATAAQTVKSSAKQLAKDVLGDEGVRFIRKFIGQ